MTERAQRIDLEQETGEPVTVRQLARALSFSRAKLLMEIECGKLHAYRSSETGKYLIKWQEARRYANSIGYYGNGGGQ